MINQNGTGNLTSFNAASGSYLPFYIAKGATGTWNLGGNATASIGTLYVGYTTTGIVNQTGGTLNTNAGTVIFPTVSSGSGYAAGTYNLFGGTLTTAGITTASTASAPNATFNFSGGDPPGRGQQRGVHVRPDRRQRPGRRGPRSTPRRSTSASASRCWPRPPAPAAG